MKYNLSSAKNTKFSVLCILLLIPIFLVGIDEDAGTTGFTFLKVIYSARAAAMGNAYTGLSNDASAVFFNPSGLVQLTKNEAQITYMSYLDGVNCGSAVYGYKYDEKTSFGFFAKGLNASEDRTIVDEYGQYAGTDGTFGVSDFVVGISAARTLLPILDLGVNVKFLQESLDDQSATAAAFDVGIMHQTTNKNLKVGIALRNIGKQLSYFTENEYEEKMPITATLGFNLHPNEKLYATLDIYKPLNYDYLGRIGAEYKIHEMLFLRAGYKTNASDWKTGGDDEALAGMSFGFGLNLQQYKLKMDYAISSYGDLGFVNQITMGYLF
ncbi:MAG: PorV/PorQ family protein [Candidatus Cloacimonetes bacterium]|nr:PorV/PorQ family protein [Candidatus Cloacimonadota bacterium]MCF7813050.1 PorV/PorQ family protein [Candidatus Cloacimonadota bacterium]MCF7867209.1 PorV/PorQ family protein [Candidatus Cloacimonadota bacterium]MCF7882653.1 PorV/PorQ family protein [Candidatus Cloacimonadota bacterium]